MNTKQKVRVIQLLENNLFFVDERDPSDIIMPYSMLQLATLSYLTRKIKASQCHLESSDEMNAEIYCVVV